MPVKFPESSMLGKESYSSPRKLSTQLCFVAGQEAFSFLFLLLLAITLFYALIKRQADQNPGSEANQKEEWVKAAMITPALFLPSITALMLLFRYGLKGTDVS